MADAKIKFIVDLVDKFSGKAKKVNKELDKMGDGSQKSSKGIFTLENAFKAAGAIMASRFLAQAGGAVLELNELGVQADRADRALQAFTGGSDEAAAALEAVLKVTGGAVDKLTATQNAAKLFSMGLAETAEEAGKLTEIAMTLGAAMGKGPQEAFEQFTLLLANKSILRLDTFGISASQVKNRMAELREETKDLTSEQAFLQATLEIGEGSLKALKEEGFEAASASDKLKASWTDLKLTFAESSDIEEAIGWLDLNIKSLNDATIANEMYRHAVDGGILTNIEANRILIQAERGAITYAEAIERLIILEEEYARANERTHGLRSQVIAMQRRATDEIEENNDALAEQARLLDKVNTNLDNTIQGYKDQIKWIEAGGLAMQKAAEEAMQDYKDGTITAAEAQEELNRISAETQFVMGEFDGMSMAQIAQTLRDDLGIPLGEAFALAMSVAGKLAEIDGSTVEATIIINRIGGGPGEGIGAGWGLPDERIDDPNYGTAGQAGLNFVAPPTWTNDRGIVRVGAGERVRVTSKSNTQAQGIESMFGGASLDELGEAIARAFDKRGAFEL